VNKLVEAAAQEEQPMQQQADFGKRKSEGCVDMIAGLRKRHQSQHALLDLIPCMYMYVLIFPFACVRIDSGRCRTS